MAVSYPTIYKKVKEIISDITGISVNEIYADTELAPNPLGFTLQGLRALAPILNNAFANEGLDLQRSEMTSLQKIRSIAQLIHSKNL